jgi:uncharacterized protein YcbX
MQSVGVIRQIARYPVKSMRGEALPEVQAMHDYRGQD